MHSFNHRINAYFLPRTSVENVDGKYVLVIWVPTGPFIGPITKVISDTLSYLRTNVIEEHIVKPANDKHSICYFNYLKVVPLAFQPSNGNRKTTVSLAFSLKQTRTDPIS